MTSSTDLTIALAPPANDSNSRGPAEIGISRRIHPTLDAKGISRGTRIFFRQPAFLMTALADLMASNDNCRISFRFRTP